MSAVPAQTEPLTPDLIAADPFVTAAWASTALAAATAQSALADEPAQAVAPAIPTAPPTVNPVAQMRAELETEFSGAPIETGPIVGVPRITIHVFCLETQTAGAVETALRDRRLFRATGVIFPGGLPAALERYRTHPTPALVIVETLREGDAVLADLDLLADVCDAGTKVMVMGRANDITLYRELLARGVSQYLVTPLDPMKLIDAVSRIYEDPSAPFIGRTVAVIGARGGVGASMLAHNLAYALSEKLEANTILVDLDLPFGAAGMNFNQDPVQGVANALAQPDRLDPILLERMMARCTDKLSLFAAPATLDEDYEIGAEAYVEVTEKLKGVAPFVVLDVPHAWSAWVRATLLSADETVVVATPDLTSLRNAKNLIDLLKRGRPNDGPPLLVLNQVGVPGRPEISVKDFADTIGLEPALVLPFDPKLFGEANNNGQMLDEINPKAKAAAGITALAFRVGKREPIAQPAKVSFLAGLLKRKR
jgi:pilus assembly protein CpaE